MPQSNSIPSFDESLLTELGLSHNEIIVYTTLLCLPEATLPTLVIESGLARTLLYYLIEHLQSFGLVRSYKREKKTWYQAEAPERLHEIARQRLEQAERQKTMLVDVVASLSGVYRLAQNKPGVRFFEGHDGVVAAYEELLDLKQPIDSIEDKGEMATFIPDYFPRFIKRRVKLGIFNRVIAPSTNPINSTSVKEMRETRLVPLGQFPFGMDIKIAGNTVLMVTLEAGQAIAIRIDHPLIAANMKILFNFLWGKV